MSSLENQDGTIYTRVGETPAGINISLGDLSNVGIQNPQTGEILIYNAETGLWENGTQSEAATPIDELDELTDTNITNPQNNDQLIWDSATSKWINTAVPPSAGIGQVSDDLSPEYGGDMSTGAFKLLVGARATAAGEIFDDVSATTIRATNKSLLLSTVGSVALTLSSGSDLVLTSAGDAMINGIKYPKTIATAGLPMVAGGVDNFVAGNVDATHINETASRVFVTPANKSSIDNLQSTAVWDGIAAMTFDVGNKMYDTYVIVDDLTQPPVFSLAGSNNINGNRIIIPIQVNEGVSNVWTWGAEFVDGSNLGALPTDFDPGIHVVEMQFNASLNRVFTIIRTDVVNISGGTLTGDLNFAGNDALDVDDLLASGVIASSTNSVPGAASVALNLDLANNWKITNPPSTMSLAIPNASINGQVGTIEIDNSAGNTITIVNNGAGLAGWKPMNGQDPLTVFTATYLLITYRVLLTSPVQVAYEVSEIAV